MIIVPAVPSHIVPPVFHARIVFYLAAAIFMFGSICFLLLASGEVQVRATFRACS